MKIAQQKMLYTGVAFVLVVVAYFGWLRITNYFFYQEMPEHWQPMPLPELQSSTVLRAVYVENPRFKSLTDLQINKILDRTTELVSQHLFAEVKFERKADLSVQALFDILPFVAKKNQSKKIIYIDDEKNELESFNKIRNSISVQIQNSASSAQSQIDYANPYLIEKKEIKSLDGLTAELTKTLIQRHQFWVKKLANDGKSVLDGSSYNQWIYWDALGYGNLPYDVIITNQLVASIEENGMPVHTCLRGGINGGNTTYSKQGLSGGFVFVSAFQMMNNNALLTILREDETYTEQQIIDYTAATLTHELGHLLFHYAHPFNAQSCIMNPTPLLHYRQWYEQLDVQACQLLNSPMQQPGAAKITYNTEW